METASGIDGFFFRARDPVALGRWYRDHPGITLAPSNYDDPPPEQQAGPTPFAPFPEDTGYCGDAGKL